MKSFKKIFEILDKWKWYYITAGVMLLASVGFRMLEPKVLQLAIDKVVVFYTSSGTKQAPGDVVSVFLYSFLPALNVENAPLVLVYLGVMFLVISLLRAVFQFGSGTISASSTEMAVKKLKDKLFEHIQLLPMAYHSKVPTGELIQRCTGDVETIRKFSSIQVVEVIRMGGLLVGSFIMMALIDITYAFIAIASFPIIIIGSRYFFKKESAIWTEHEKQQDRLTSIAQENLSGIRVVKAFAKEQFEIEKFTKQNVLKRSWGLKHLKLHAAFWPLSDLLVYTQLAVTIFAGGYFTITGKITLGEYMAFNTYASLVTWPLRRIAQLVSEMGITSVAIGRIYSILESIKEDYSGSDNDGLPIAGEVEFDNVSFAYNGEEKHVLNGISFKIAPGEKIALLGPTGSGKSTVISLLMRFYEPDSGIIRIDGKNIREYSKRYLRRNIGVVLQKPFLFSTTIKDNIAYSDPASEIEEVEDAAKTSKIHEVIEEMFPKSYETVVGEKGVTLSGGQKQRVAIARTLLKDPDILVLDDSTSSVDTETEYMIQRALSTKTKGRTIIIITHRITSIQGCDRIIVLDKGRVAETGTHDELIAKNGFYKKIYNIQLAIEDEIKTDEANGNGIPKPDAKK